MFELFSASKSYDGALVLQPCDLRLERGRTSVLIGPSGCGKSTLIRLLIGLVAPNSGSVRFDGEALTRENALTLRLRMGYVIQDGGLFPHLTAEENISLLARHLGWEKERIRSRVKELTRLTQFPNDALDRYPVQISGGQRQRVSLMRALMLDPDVLLLDEPLGALDPMIRFELQTDLKRVFDTLGKTVVMVTHDMAEAAFFGDSIILMRDGHIVQRGTLNELIETPCDDFVVRFLQAQRALHVSGEREA